MKWEKVTSTIGDSVYALWNNGRKLITLAFNPSSNAARIESDQEKRVFLIRQEGLLKNRTVLTNEYGIRIGHLGSVGQENYFELNNERYFYDVEGKDHLVRIFKGSRENPIAVCEMELESSMKPSTNTSKKLSDRTYNSLLMTLCWYLFQPAVNNNPNLIAVQV